MRKIRYILILFCALCASTQAQQRYVGGDISLLPKYEQYNSAYKDAYGSSISNLLTWFIADCGWNTFRVRLFVNPQQKAANGNPDPAVCQDLAYVTALGQRIKAAGAYFLLDFHYSDTWVDALNIQAPAAWSGASADAMADSLGNYTHRVLQTLKAANATPDLIQVGNEIMYGLCGIAVSPYDDASRNANWPSFINLLKAGCDAVREECPNAQIIIHTDHPNEVSNTKYYYTKLINNGVDFDIIGLSYYPFWHGYLTSAQSTTNLVSSINAYAATFPSKQIQIVECAYNFQYWPSSGVKYNTQSIWPCSKVGQYNFVKDLVDALKPLQVVTGISYWFPEEAGNGDNTNWTTQPNGAVLKDWLNRGFWDENKSTSGHAINKTGTASSSNPPENVCAPYYMRNFYNEEQSLDNTPFLSGECQGEATKILLNGQLLIERSGHRFSLTGQHL